jgi:hypothetical protein
LPMAISVGVFASIFSLMMNTYVVLCKG